MTNVRAEPYQVALDGYHERRIAEDSGVQAPRTRSFLISLLRTIKVKVTGILFIPTFHHMRVDGPAYKIVVLAPALCTSQILTRQAISRLSARTVDGVDVLDVIEEYWPQSCRGITPDCSAKNVQLASRPALPAFLSIQGHR